MKILTEFTDELASTLRSGGIAVIRTDTIYGIVGRADTEASVERIYAVKGRTPTKSPITLIGRPEDMFDRYEQSMIDRLADLWPGKNSIILPSKDAPVWIVRTNASVAYRIPADEPLCALLEKTGPLIAPSANPEGLTPAMNIQEAIDYFGDDIDIYVDGGQVTDNTPSNLYAFGENGMERLR